MDSVLNHICPEMIRRSFGRVRVQISASTLCWPSGTEPRQGISDSSSTERREVLKNDSTSLWTQENVLKVDYVRLLSKV